VLLKNNGIHLPIKAVSFEKLQHFAAGKQSALTTFASVT
jgi:hypothetical protein